ncbi:MAG: UbiA family prenyltransferase [Bacteroidota bacterium]
MIKKYIELARPLNLLLIAITLLVSRYAVLYPFLVKNEMSFAQPFWAFCILLLSICLIAAYGYYINDFQDLKTDSINKKSRVLLRHPGMHDKAKNLSFHLLTAGLFLGAIAWYISGNTILVLMHIFAAASLYFYSKNLQRTLLLGNLSIALLCGVLPIIILGFDGPSLIGEYFNEIDIYFIGDEEKTYNERFFQSLMRQVLYFSGFIFLLTLQREIMKDLEDHTGDLKDGYRTLAIRYGKDIAIQFFSALGILLLLLFAVYFIVEVNVLLSENAFVIAAIAAFIFIIVPQVQAMLIGRKGRFRSSVKMLKINIIGAFLYWFVFAICY